MLFTMLVERIFLVIAASTELVWGMDVLDGLRQIFIRAMRQQGVSVCELARATELDRGHLSYILKGIKPLTPPIIEKLLNHLEIERDRMGLAVFVMQDHELYFKPHFKAMTHYVRSILICVAEVTSPDSGIDYGLIFSGLSNGRCEELAQSAMLSLTEPFAGLSSMLSLNLKDAKRPEGVTAP